MLQRSSAPMPLNLATSTQDNVEPKVGVQRIDDLPTKPQQQPQHHQSPPKPHRSLFSSNFSFGAGAAAPSPPPSAGLPQSRPRANRSKSPSSARSSMLVDDEDTEWDTTKLLPQFQHTIRRPSLLTPPTTSDARRSSYDKNIHLGYDDGSTEVVPPGRRSSVPTHHLRPESSPDRHHAGFRRSSLATTVMNREDIEEEEQKIHVETLSEVDSAEEELAADNLDLEGMQAQTAEMKLEDSKPPTASLKRDSDDMEEPNIHSAANTPMPNPFLSLNNIPYPYIFKRLMDLGPYFVGHEPTAQAFVEAIQYNEKTSDYKVEVVPRDNKSETFRIVKRYKYSEDTDESEHSDESPPPDSPVNVDQFDDDEVEYTSPSLPVHVEYAVFRLPLLGSMLLSGQVFCGDTLKVPLPYPEVWTAVVGWMYTNKVVRLPGMEVQEQAAMVRECIEFLGGHV